MYCKHCGKEIDEQAAICVACGYSNGVGKNYCWHCGSPIADENAQVCVSCGYPLHKVKAGTKGKSKLAAGLLGIFLGGCGVHNFYLGYTGKAIAQIFVSLCSCGIGSIWGFIEGILLLCGKIDTDADGNLLQD